RLHVRAWVRHREKRLKAGVTPRMSRVSSAACSRSGLNPRQDSVPNRILKEMLDINGSYVDPKRPTILLECIIFADVIMSLRCDERHGLVIFFPGWRALAAPFGRYIRKHDHRISASR